MIEELSESGLYFVWYRADGGDNWHSWQLTKHSINICIRYCQSYQKSGYEPHQLRIRAVEMGDAYGNKD